jgi:T5SS/PEP-CTERM-associated repeat protein/autotransporter-associated beta strand protein
VWLQRNHECERERVVDHHHGRELGVQRGYFFQLAASVRAAESARRWRAECGAGTLIVAGTAGGSGTLNIGNGGVAGVLNASAVQMGNGTGLVNFNHTGTVDFAIPISGVGALSQFGTGTTNLTAVNTFTRAVTVTGGTLELSGGGQINNAFDSSVASGNLLITDAGSQWMNTATTYIGDTGTGVATVQDGGLLQAGTALLLSRFGGGNGTLTVTGAGSAATTNGERASRTRARGCWKFSTARRSRAERLA